MIALCGSLAIFAACLGAAPIRKRSYKVLKTVAKAFFAALSLLLWYVAILVYLRNPSVLDVGWWITTLLIGLGLWVSVSQIFRRGIKFIAIGCCAIGVFALSWQLDTAVNLEEPLQGQGAIVGYVGALGVRLLCLCWMHRKR